MDQQSRIEAILRDLIPSKIARVPSAKCLGSQPDLLDAINTEKKAPITFFLDIN